MSQQAASIEVSEVDRRKIVNTLSSLETSYNLSLNEMFVADQHNTLHRRGQLATAKLWLLGAYMFYFGSNAVELVGQILDIREKQQHKDGDTLTLTQQYKALIAKRDMFLYQGRTRPYNAADEAHYTVSTTTGFAAAPWVCHNFPLPE